ncbi:hypothetical protein Tco_1257342, partial [Tanacetum coccineum]
CSKYIIRFERQDWISYVWGTSQDAMTSHGVTAVLAVWYPNLVKPSLAMLCVHPLLKLVMAMNDKYNSTAAEILAEVSLMTLIRVTRGSPRNLAPYLDKITSINNLISKYSMTKIKILDASGPPGLPTLLGGTSDTTPKTAISALSFSPDGEGLIAFSEHGLIIRWWSLGSMWWEKLSRNLVHVQCTKLIFVPPWQGFSPTSTRSVLQTETQLYHPYEDISDYKEYNENGDTILRPVESSRTIIEAMSTYCFKIVETLIVDIEPDVHMKKTMNEINTIDSPLSWDKIASDHDQDRIEDNRKKEQ